ncbi:MAG: phosphotransferase [Verrucomicrobiota bacterium]
MNIESTIRSVTGVTDIGEPEVVQSLWSGYGSIVRYPLEGWKYSSVIVKHVSPPGAQSHPRGWNTSLSHRRKLRSYQIEAAWYQNYSARCSAESRVGRCFSIEKEGDEIALVLEDLNASGYALRRTQVNDAELEMCINWLAHFHATFLGEECPDLWPVGTYWHLDTRQDELEVLKTEDAALAGIAGELDRLLRASPFQTLVHGDAKLANFCFSKTNDRVAAVDFQYVGGGCGMKDLAYFIGSCLSEDECSARESELLGHYFKQLRAAIDSVRHPVDVGALEADWRSLYPIAWTDFHRFLKGWSPGHWKINSYSERVASNVVCSLNENH